MKVWYKVWYTHLVSVDRGLRRGVAQPVHPPPGRSVYIPRGGVVGGLSAIPCTLGTTPVQVV